MSIYLVTGGAGFIGSHIVKKLVSNGYQVRVIDNLSNGKLENFSSVLTRIEFIKGDILDTEVLQKAVSGVDYVIHHAAQISVLESIKTPMSYHNSNVTGTLMLLEHCRRFNIKRVVIASSSAVYGNGSKLPLVESSNLDPTSPYGLSKYIDELYAKQYYNLYKLETVCLRYFNVYGPGQNAHSPYSAVIPKFINKLMTGEMVRIYGDGNQTRDFVFIDDIVKANLLACSAPNCGGEVFNIAGGLSISVNNIYNKICKLIKVNRDPVYTTLREGEVIHSFAAIKKAETMLNFLPQVSIDEGLKQTINWYYNYQEVAPTTENMK